MAIWSLSGLVMPWRDMYELWVVQKAVVSGCIGRGSGYNVGGCNIGGYNGRSGYIIGGYTMVACSPLYKQLYWEFGVSYNCFCIISEGPLMYVVTCLETFYIFNKLF